MKPVDLAKVWAAPDNSRLTAKQQSFRLPVHVAAKIQALCDLYPHRTKTEIVGDLLSTALEGVAQGFWTAGRPIGRDENGETVHEDVLSFEGSRFQEAANKHFKALERELGNKNPSDLFPKS
jgi:hypothetical protein